MTYLTKRIKLSPVFLLGSYLSGSMGLATPLMLPPVKVTPHTEDAITSEQPAATPYSEKTENKTVPVTQAMGLVPQLKSISHLNFIKGGRQLNGLPAVRGLSGSQISFEIDGVPNPFSHFSHHAMRLLPFSGLLQSVTIGQSGDSAKGNGTLGGSISFHTPDPASFLNTAKPINTEFTQSIQSGAPGLQSSLAVSAKSTNYQGLFKIQGNKFGDFRTGNGHSVAYSAQQNLQQLAKLKFQPTEIHSVNFSMLSLQNWSESPSLSHKPVSDTNPLGQLDLTQKQAQLSYTVQPKDLRIDLNIKLYHLSTHQSFKPVLGKSSQSTPQLPHNITLNSFGFELHNMQPLAPVPSGSDTDAPNVQLSELPHLYYGFQVMAQTGEDAVKSDTFLNYPSGVQRQQAALFAKTQLHLTPRLQLSPGLRLEHSRHSKDNIIASPFTSLNKQLSLNFDANEYWQIQARYAEAQRLPNLDELYLGGIHPKLPHSRMPNIRLIPNPNLKAETSAYKELGVQYHQQNNIQTQAALTWSAHVFLNDLQHYISHVKVQDPAHPQDRIFQNQNIGPVRIYGAHLSLNYSQTNQMRWYITGEITRGYHVEAYSSLSGDLAKGSPLANLPPANSRIGVIIPLAKPQGEFQLHAQAAIGATTRHSSYLLWDIHYRWNPPIPGLEFYFSAENILDTDYETALNDPVARTPILTPAMGRNLSIMMRYCV